MIPARYVALVVACLLSSCTSADSFQQPRASAPHAVLEGRNAFAFAVNGTAGSFWRASKSYRIAPGRTVIDPAYSDRRITHGYKEVAFSALAGHRYGMERVVDEKVVSPFSARLHPSTAHAWIVADRRDRIVVRDVTAPTKPVLMVEAPLEDSVFGVASADEAISQYQLRKKY